MCIYVYIYIYRYRYVYVSLILILRRTLRIGRDALRGALELEFYMYKKSYNM